MGHRPPHPVQRHVGVPRLPLPAVPFALVAVVTVVDVLAPPDLHLGSFPVAAPAVTASFAGPWMTGFVGAVAVAAQVTVAVVRTTATDLNHTFQIIALVLISILVTLFAHLREVHEKQLTQLRSVAGAAQEVLRPLRDRMDPLRPASVYLAAEAEARDAQGASCPLPARAADWPGDGPEALLHHLRGPAGALPGREPGRRRGGGRHRAHRRRCLNRRIRFPP